MGGPGGLCELVRTGALPDASMGLSKVSPSLMLVSKRSWKIALAGNTGCGLARWLNGQVGEPKAEKIPRDGVDRWPDGELQESFVTPDR